jgi:hypothetical protein
MFLTPEQLVELTQRKRSDAQRRELDHMGIPYKVRRDGSLAVLRLHAEPAAGTPPRAAKEPELNF